MHPSGKSSCERYAQVYYMRNKPMECPSDTEIFHDCESYQESQELTTLTQSLESPQQFHNNLKEMVITTRQLLCKMESTLQPPCKRKPIAPYSQPCKTASNTSTGEGHTISLEIHLQIPQCPNGLGNISYQVTPTTVACNECAHHKQLRAQISEAQQSNKSSRMDCVNPCGLSEKSHHSVLPVTASAGPCEHTPGEIFFEISDSRSKCTQSPPKPPPKPVKKQPQELQKCISTGTSMTRFKVDKATSAILLKTPSKQKNLAMPAYDSFLSYPCYNEHNQSHTTCAIQETLLSTATTRITHFLNSLFTYMGGYADDMQNMSPTTTISADVARQRPCTASQHLKKSEFDNKSKEPCQHLKKPDCFSTSPPPCEQQSQQQVSTPIVVVFPIPERNQACADHLKLSKPPSYASIAEYRCHDPCPYKQALMPSANAAPMPCHQIVEEIAPTEYLCESAPLNKSMSELTLVPDGARTPAPPPPPPKTETKKVEEEVVDKISKGNAGDAKDAKDAKDVVVKKPEKEKVDERRHKVVACCGRTASYDMICGNLTSKERLYPVRKDKNLGRAYKECVCGERATEKPLEKCNCQANGQLDEYCRIPICIEEKGECACDCSDLTEKNTNVVKCCNLAIDSECICMGYFKPKYYKKAVPQHTELKLCIACRFDPSPLIDENGKVFCPGNCGCCLCPWKPRKTASAQVLEVHDKIRVCKCRERGTIFNITTRESVCSDVVAFDLCPCREVAEAKFLELYGKEMGTLTEAELEKIRGKDIALTDVVELRPPHKIKSHKKYRT